MHFDNTWDIAKDAAINTETLDFEESYDAHKPQFAIPSHRWEEDGVFYLDFTNENRGTKKGCRKIAGLVDLARNDGLSHAWIDTCCVGKTSSSELSEDINSRFARYQDAFVCSSYLADVLDVYEAANDTPFMESEWFTRGWTLQELLAPRQVHFFDSSWKFIATRDAAASQIARGTGIDIEVLKQQNDFLGKGFDHKS